MNMPEYVNRKLGELRDSLYSLKDYLPRPTKSILKNVSFTGAALTMIASSALGCVRNEVKDYEIEKNLPAGVIQQFKPLEPLLDANKKKFIDAVANYSGREQLDLAKLAVSGKVDDTEVKFLDVLSSYSQSEQEKVISAVTQDSTVDESEYKGLVYLSKSSVNTKDDIISDLGLNGDILKWLSVLGDLKNGEFASYALSHKLTIEDKKLTDLEVNFLNNPDGYKQDLFNYYLSASNKINPELGTELHKLPDFNPLKIKDIEAVEDISVLTSGYIGDPKLAGVISIQDLLSTEGIKDSIKYCTPLQDLAWTLYDNEGKQLNDCPWVKEDSRYNKNSLDGEKNLSKFVQYVWRTSSESNNYKSDRWKDFDEVIERLNSPSLVALYMTYNIPYDYDGGTSNTGKLPKDTFVVKKGICIDQSTFALYCLLKNGYVYDNFDKNTDNSACALAFIGNLLSHAVCLFTKDNSFYYINGVINMDALYDKTIKDKWSYEGVFQVMESNTEKGLDSESRIKKGLDKLVPDWNYYWLLDNNSKMTGKEVYRK